eukprot:4711298-Pleurochrysis_carterae.AAC.3
MGVSVSIAGEPVCKLRKIGLRSACFGAGPNTSAGALRRTCDPASQVFFWSSFCPKQSSIRPPGKCLCSPTMSFSPAFSVADSAFTLESLRRHAPCDPASGAASTRPARTASTTALAPPESVSIAPDLSKSAAAVCGRIASRPFWAYVSSRCAMLAMKRRAPRCAGRVGGDARDVIVGWRREGDDAK